jgi:hypothetical protein
MTHFSGQCKSGTKGLHKMAGDRLKLRRGCGEKRGKREKTLTSLPLAALPSPSSSPALTPAPVLARRGPARFTASVDGPRDWAGALSVRFSWRALLQGLR